MQLTRKDADWEWGAAQAQAMEELKEAIHTAPCLQPIDYHTEGSPVIMAVDSSNIGVGWLLLQIGQDGRRYPNRFRSLNWNERESCYSQPKIEIYGLWCAMRAMQLYLLGVPRLVIEVDAQFIKGMLANLDVQPNAAVVRGRPLG